MNIMARRLPARPNMRRKNLGQAMIEYLVVLSFGVVVIMQGGSATSDPPIKQLSNAIKDYHKHYTYAMAIASIPECDAQLAYDKSSTVGDIVSLSGGVTIGYDRCVDWQNISATPLPTLSFTSSLGITDNIKDFIKQKIKDTVSASIDQFINPTGLLDDMLDFSPSSFF